MLSHWFWLRPGRSNRTWFAPTQQSDGEPLQTQPPSIAQFALQPSSSADWLPSSHCSPISTTPLPQQPRSFGPTTHAPPTHLSPEVHVLPSLHGLLSAFTGFEQVPVAGLQTPAT